MKGIIAVMLMLVAGSAVAIEMPALAIEHKCNLCHSIDKKIVGPSFKDVANRYRDVSTYTYRGKEYPLREGLVIKLSNGGAGNWGSMPMYPIDPDDLSQGDLKQLVDFILKLPD
jgi:cytochrome c